MELKLDDLKDMAKIRGLDLADDVLEMFAKGGADLLLDLVEQAAKESENKWDDALVLAVMPKLREMAKAIQVKL